MRNLLFILLFFLGLSNAYALDEGWYTISPSESSAYKFDGKTLKITSNLASQKFYISKKADGTYSLKNYFKTVELPGKWKIMQEGNFYTIQNSQFLSYNHVKDNSPVFEGAKKLWKLVPYGENRQTVVFKDGSKVLSRQSLNKGSSATAPVTPTKTGYTFAGWDKTFSKITANTTINAKWKPKTVTVVFHRNKNRDDTATWKETYTYDVSNQKFGMKTSDMKFGGWPYKTLSGWAWEPDATEKQYSTTSSVSNNWINTNSGTVHLYAVWTGTSNGLIRALHPSVALNAGAGDFTQPWSQGAIPQSYVEFKGKTLYYLRGEKGTQDHATYGKSEGSLPYVYQPGSILSWTPNKTPIFTPDYIKEDYSNFIEDSTYNIKVPVYNNVMDSRAFVFNGKVHIFYMHRVYGMTADGKREMEEYLKNEGKEYTIAARDKFLTSVTYAEHAVSEDGVTFKNLGRIQNTNDKTRYWTYGSILPTFVRKEKKSDNTEGDVAYTFTGKNNGISVATSENLTKWSSLSQVITKDDLWAGANVDTFSIFNDNAYIYLVFCGTSQGADYPEAIGVARARINSDLTKKENWEVYPHNPILVRGASSTADSGAVWGASIYEYNNEYYLVYEGAGVNRPEQFGAYSELSVREIPYYAYRFYNKSTNWNYSRVVVAKLNTNDLQKAWKEKPIEGNVKIKNVTTGKYLDVKDITIGTSNNGTTFNLSFDGNFYRLKYNNLYLRPWIHDTAVDTFGNFLKSLDKYYSKLSEREAVLNAYYYKDNSNIITKNISKTDWRSIRGVQWIIAKDGSYYTIRNRATGCYLNATNDSTVVQSPTPQKWMIESK